MAKKKLIPEYDMKLGDDTKVQGGTIQNIYDKIDESEKNFAQRLSIQRREQQTGGMTFQDIARNFVSKLKDDRIRGNITMEKSLLSDDYSAGTAGAGFFVGKDGNDKSFIEVDNLHVRETLKTTILTHDKVTAIGGTFVISEAYLEVERVEQTNAGSNENHRVKAFFKPVGVPLNIWRVNDQIRLQSGHDRLLYSYVTAISTELTDDGLHWIEIYHGMNTGKIIGDTIPQKGDSIVQWGNREDAARQAIIEITSHDGGRISMYQGVGAYDAAGVGAYRYSTSEKNEVEIGYLNDGGTWKTMLRVYGDMFFGDRNGSSYLKYTKATKSMEFKGDAVFTSSNLDEWGVKALRLELTPPAMVIPVNSGTFTVKTGFDPITRPIPYLYGEEKSLVYDNITIVHGENCTVTLPLVGGKRYVRVSKLTANNGWADIKYSLDGHDDTVRFVWATTEDGANGANGADGQYTEYQFSKNTSLTVAPVTGWQDAPPALASGEYLWMRTRVVGATVGAWSAAVRISGEDGEDAIVGYLTNESATLPASSGGVVSSFAGASGQFKVFDGLVDKTTSATFIKVSNTGCKAAITTGGAYSVSAMDADTATAVFRATYNTVVIEKTLTLSKSKQGVGVASLVRLFKALPKAQSAPSAPVSGNGDWGTAMPAFDATKKLWECTRVIYSDASESYTTVYENKEWAEMAAQSEKIADILSDSMVTPAEKRELKLIWSEINAQFSVMEERVGALGLTSSYYWTLYSNAYMVLDATFYDILEDMDESTPIDPDQLNQDFESYYTTYQDIVNLANDTAITEQIDKVEVGGKNLLRNSNFLAGTKDWVQTGGTVTPHTTGQIASGALAGVRIVATAAWQGMYQILGEQLEVGKEYIVSFLAKATVNGKQMRVGVESAGWTDYTLTTIWKLYTQKFTATAQGNFAVYALAAGTYDITNFQLQQGTKRTPYSNDYLEDAIRMDTTIKGGLVLSTLIGARDTGSVVRSYMSGLTDRNVAFAAGVDNFGTGSETRKIELNHDGSGHLAGSRIRWDKDGENLEISSEDEGRQVIITQENVPKLDNGAIKEYIDKEYYVYLNMNNPSEELQFPSIIKEDTFEFELDFDTDSNTDISMYLEIDQKNLYGFGYDEGLTNVFFDKYNSATDTWSVLYQGIQYPYPDIDNTLTMYLELAGTTPLSKGKYRFRYTSNFGYINVGGSPAYFLFKFTAGISYKYNIKRVVVGIDGISVYDSTTDSYILINSSGDILTAKGNVQLLSLNEQYGLRITNTGVQKKVAGSWSNL